MTASTYLYERQSEYWTSRQIEEFFFDRGFSVTTLPIPQGVEKLLPADFVFSANSFIKIFGLQFKALYRNEEDYWAITKHQHDRLQKYRWIYYGLSEMKNAVEYRSALHWCRFVDANFPYQAKLYMSGANRLKSYRKWAAFYESLAGCSRGERVNSALHLQDLFMAGQDDPRLERLARAAADVFLIDFNNRMTVHYSPLMRSFEGQ